MGEAVSFKESDSATLSGCVAVVLTTTDLEGLSVGPNKGLCKHGIANGSPEGTAAMAILSLMLPPSSVSVYTRNVY